MEYIENQTFYHIQRKNNGINAQMWNVGDTYFIGQQKNRFFEVFDYLTVPVQQGNIHSYSNALGHTTKTIRELSFEEIRKEFFPAHPSRQRGIWVIKPDKDSLDYWKNELGSADQIIKVQLTGKIHKANQEYLKATTDSLNTIRQRAFHYWTGTSGANIVEEEILFEGFAEVIEIIE